MLDAIIETTKSTAHKNFMMSIRCQFLLARESEDLQISAMSKQISFFGLQNRENIMLKVADPIKQ